LDTDVIYYEMHLHDMGEKTGLIACSNIIFFFQMNYKISINEITSIQKEP